MAKLPGMTQKWSSRPAQHNPTRIRDNQRRHRARIKTRMADLENELADTRMLLDEAQKENMVLKTELAILAASIKGGNGTNNSLPATSQHSQQDPLLETDTVCSPTRAGSRAGPLGPIRSEDDKLIDSPNSERVTTSDTTFPQETLLDGETDCPSLPLPGPGESTILCKAAYTILKQQTQDGLDIRSVEAFLAPGFRRATSPGEGCRVDSVLVFSLLDEMSPLA